MMKKLMMMITCIVVLISNSISANAAHQHGEECYTIQGAHMSDGTLWEVQTALYFRWTCLSDGAVPELAAGFGRNDRRLS